MSTDAAHTGEGPRRDAGTEMTTAQPTSATEPTAVASVQVVHAHCRVLVLLVCAAAVLLLASSVVLRPVTSALAVASGPMMPHLAARPLADAAGTDTRVSTVPTSLQLRGVSPVRTRLPATRTGSTASDASDSAVAGTLGHSAATRAQLDLPAPQQGTGASDHALATFNNGRSTTTSGVRPPHELVPADADARPLAPSAAVARLPLLSAAQDASPNTAPCVPLVAVSTFTSTTLTSSVATLLPLLTLAEKCNRVSVVVYMDSQLSAGSGARRRFSNATQISAHVRDVMMHYTTANMAHMQARYMNLYDIPPEKRQLPGQHGAAETVSPDGSPTFMSSAVIRRIVGFALPHCSRRVHDNATITENDSSISDFMMHRKRLEALVARALPNAVTVVPFLFPDHALDASVVAREAAITIATLHATVHISNHPCLAPTANVGIVSTARSSKRARQRAAIPVTAPPPSVTSGVTIVGITSSTVHAPSFDLLQALSAQSPTLSTRGLVMFGASLGVQRASVSDLAPVDWRLRLNMDINKGPYQRVHGSHALELLAVAAPLATEGLVSGLMALYCASSQHCLWPVEHVRAPHAIEARLTTLVRVSALAYSSHAISTVRGAMTLIVPASARAPSLDLQLIPSASLTEPTVPPGLRDADAVHTIHAGDTAASDPTEPGSLPHYARPYSRLQYGKKRFVYLIQGESWATSNETLMVHAGLPSTDVILLCWGKPCHDAAGPNIHTIFAPHSSWNEGRNRLMWAAIQLERTVNDGPYEFFAFMDEDVKLHCAAGKGAACAYEMQAILDKHKAPITSARWWDICDVEPWAEVSYVDVFDAIYNVFHRLSLGSFLPYHEDFDHISWYVSQAILFYQAVCIRGLVLQTNSVWVTNGMHRDYPKGATCKPKLADNSVAPVSLQTYVNWPCTGCVLKGYHPRAPLVDIDPATLAPGWTTHICNATMIGDGLHAKSVAVLPRVRKGLKGKKNK